MRECPSCGRYVGRRGTCPYCGSLLPAIPRISILKVIAASVAVLGQVFIWLGARGMDVPLIRVAQIDASMSGSYVRLAGRCVTSPRYEGNPPNLSFWLEDETGDVLVTAFRPAASHLLESHDLPRLGDLVAITGTVRYKPGFRSLAVDAADCVAVRRSKPRIQGIRSISPQDIYSRVLVQGQIRAIRRPYTGLTIIDIRDMTGSLPILLGDDLPANGGDPVTWDVGQSLSAVATVSEYQGSPQLVIASLRDIGLLKANVQIARHRAIASLSDRDIGEFVEVRGTITDTGSFSAGKWYLLDDGTATLKIVLWRSFGEGLPPLSTLDVGSEAIVRGRLSRYGDTMELVPELTLDVDLLPPRAASAPMRRRVDQLTSRDIGSTVVLAGTAGPLRTFPGGVYCELYDGSGSLDIVMWDDQFDDVTATIGLRAGRRITVEGEIHTYAGKLEIVPEKEHVVIAN
jgi:DNA/RNA endonuclease YhcR with UshA esterase domain